MSTISYFGHSTFSHDTHLGIFSLSKAWCLMPLIPAPRSLCRPPVWYSQLMASWGYTVRPYLTKQTKPTITTHTPPFYKAAKLLSSNRVTCLPLVANPVNAWTFGDHALVSPHQKSASTNNSSETKGQKKGLSTSRVHRRRRCCQTLQTRTCRLDGTKLLDENVVCFSGKVHSG